MKKLFLIVIFIILCLLLTGCHKTAIGAVNSYFKEYNTLSDSVKKDINDLIMKELTLNDTNKLLYKEVLEKQYKNLNYVVTNEKYNGDEAIITVKVSVFDYYKAIKEATLALQNNPSIFNDSLGNYDDNKFTGYKLREMNLITEKIDYTVDLYLFYISGYWHVDSLSEEDLDKLHGIYNYES